ncbi:adenosylhomocysteinase [Streptomyces nigrescens]|uniref:Adenosylhomocysteinase n=1 Tax=Streptomyces nigrescens TaxID=1920 RepID=A0A640TQD6_STRNI|nr:adenosylhomocysteinase [Streptomyces libani]WAU00048.1 adenosylhomocysteinase [Streptomyces libani subsp. libani]GFE25738.1 adenosylhomocysteinase [Streptomyces libani subsp. libani]GGV98901.1 adenosylhomocysteinase [Streptomyces libani subsp. libani]
MESPEKARLDAFFRCITERFPAAGEVRALIITHLLSDRPAFLRAMARTTTIAAVLPKPKSVNAGALAEVRRTYAVHPLTREMLADPTSALDYLEDNVPGRDVVLLDIGGYYAPSLDTLVDKFSGRIVGVVEDTENGHQRYAALGQLPCPVFSVARSPLKDCEDHLVGRSIVFSTDALVRTRGDILTGRDACVIGFGKVGRSIAQTLRAHDLRVVVYDNDPVKQVQAHAQGFRTTASRTEAIHRAGLVLCATGNLALRQSDFAALRNGAFVASVTSSEDELELDALNDLYRRTPAGEHLTRYDVTGHYFYVLADGNAVNFLHGAAVGAYIHLVQAEIVAATSALSQGPHDPGLHEVASDDRQAIARAWLEHFAR